MPARQVTLDYQLAGGFSTNFNSEFVSQLQQTSFDNEATSLCQLELWPHMSTMTERKLLT